MSGIPTTSPAVSGAAGGARHWAPGEPAPAPYPRHREALEPPQLGVPAFSGRYENILLRPGLLMMVRDLVTLTDLRGEKETGPAIHVGLMLDGAGESWVSGSNSRFAFLPGRMSVMTAVKPVSGAFQVPAGSRFRLVDLRFEPSFLATILGDTPLFEAADDLAEQVLQAFGVSLAYVPLTAAHARVAEQILARGTDTPADLLYLEGKAIEALSLALTALGEQREALRGAKPAPPLSVRDRQRLQQARHLLVADPERTVTLRDLARQVGLNEHKLKLGFRQMFGNSVYAYLQDHRMRMAADMLERDGATVTDVALAVGYSNPAHFAKLFRRHFGVAPSRYARAHPIATPSQ